MKHGGDKCHAIIKATTKCYIVSRKKEMSKTEIEQIG